MVLYLSLFFIGCKESEQERITRLVNEWSGKVIQFPDSMCLTSYGNDTVRKKYVRERSPYTILNYVDTMGCISCRLQLLRWKEMMEELDSIYPNRVTCLMIFNPKGKTFLLDKNDKIIAIGNPVLRPKIRKLYYDIISEETVLTSTDKDFLTVISLSTDKVDLGSFPWDTKKEAEFIISNVGKVPLVINDVITSCGCITVEYSKKPIQIGKSLTLKVKYEAEHPEHFDKTITIYCNIKNAPLRLRISGDAE